MNGASALLPALLAVPLVGAILVMLLPKDEDGLARGVSLGVSIVTFALSLVILVPYDISPSHGSMQLVFDKEWIPGLGARFKLGGGRLFVAHDAVLDGAWPRREAEGVAQEAAPAVSDRGVGSRSRGVPTCR